MKKLEKKDILLIELDMLIEFDSFCRKNDLYYVLCGGTLLGAVRHKGFIPWDDDIDILMPRPDYIKLCKYIKHEKTELPPHLKYVSWFTDDSMSIPFIKMVDTRTYVEERYMDNDRFLWIDIFAIDGCPDNKKELKSIFRKSILFRKILFAKQTKKGTGTSKIKIILKNLIRVLLKPISANWICKMIEKISTGYDFFESEFIAGIQWGYGPQEKVQKDKWMKPIELEFEGHYFLCPSNYDEYLSNLYGDYMKLPPVEDRVSHDMTVYMC